MINNIDPKGKMVFKQGGFYYNATGNDALILNKYLGYKLYGVKQYRTGFGVSGQETALKKIDTLNMDYDLVDGKGNVILSKRFEENLYEIIAPDYPVEGIKTSREEPKRIKKEAKPAMKDRMSKYIEILHGLSEGVNALNGEILEIPDEDLKLHLFEMAIYFDNKLKAKAILEERYPQQGKRWTKEEDEQLKCEFEQGKNLNELSEIHKRGRGSITSRLLKLGLIANSENDKEQIEEETENGTTDKGNRETISAKSQEKTCEMCKYYQREECFGKDDICPDFESTYLVSRREIEQWPEYGDATRFRLMGKK